jgi:NH3-dependent NAD+ synthetase
VKESNSNEIIYNTISSFIKREIKKREAQGVVIGMSGGIDSS